MLLLKNNYNELEINPKKADLVFMGEYTTKYKYEDGNKTDTIEALKLKIQMTDPEQFYPVFFVQVPISKCDFETFSVLEFVNLTGRFVQKYGTREVEFVGMADSVKAIKVK